MDLYLIFQIIIVSIAATSTMTLFSYAVSASFREIYKEPLLLSYLLHNLKINLSNASKNILGWLIHYGIGVIFVVVYHYFWARNILELNFLHALLLGIASGIVGIISWMIFFKLSHYQPRIDFKGFYIQLFVAHIIFALTATAVYAISLTVTMLVNTHFAPQ
ncbi:hypothetical protein SAMN05444397_11267 [Flavobacterium aquidurense]|uniref:DUF2938 domain-containing protein n=1 Tax=Flavobacterium frigidimaris TaxID=262320 RepID=A0ABX4BKP8_FLAFR|nr:hypothetical protein [Flavobacterium frigidimaris]OXA75919.1 hypothetical protein B0A65_20415 [Flavobacterium frigidimaris]SDZ64025.1 hypothetical protein SAMN05444397_11267 [Flavobacterium aquidurense]